MTWIRVFLIAACLSSSALAAGGAEEASAPIRVALHASRPVVTPAEPVFLELELVNRTDQTQYLYAGPEKDFAGRARIRIRDPEGRESVVESPAPEADDDPSLSWLPLKPGAVQRIPLPRLNTTAHPLTGEGQYELTSEVDLILREGRDDAVPGAGQTLRSQSLTIRQEPRALEGESIPLFSLLEQQDGIALHNIRLHRGNRRGAPQEWRSLPQGDARGVFVDETHRYELSLSGGKRHLVIRSGTAADAPVLFEGEEQALQELRAIPEEARLGLSGWDYSWTHVQILMADGTYLHTEFVRQGGHLRFRQGRRAGIQFQFQRQAEVLY